jgi:hypothetical protein
MFENLNNPNESFNNYGDEEDGEEFHDSRVVKTVRSLKRQK